MSLHANNNNTDNNNTNNNNTNNNNSGARALRTTIARVARADSRRFKLLRTNYFFCVVSIVFRIQKINNL